jgi:hypothetical protein
MSDEHTVLIKGILAAVLGLVVYGARADASAEVDSVMAIGCRIEVKADGEAIRIDAVARSREDLSGRYRFDIQKISASGASHNIQSGNFSLEAGREEIISTTFLGASDANHYQAKLVLDSSSGSISCISP